MHCPIYELFHFALVLLKPMKRDWRGTQISMINHFTQILRVMVCSAAMGGDKIFKLPGCGLDPSWCPN